MTFLALFKPFTSWLLSYRRPILKLGFILSGLLLLLLLRGEELPPFLPKGSPSGESHGQTGGVLYTPALVQRVRPFPKGSPEEKQVLLGAQESLQDVTVRLLQGPFANETGSIRHVLSGQPGLDLRVKPGDRVLVALEFHPGGELEARIAGFDRMPALVALLSLFVIAWLLVTGRVGLWRMILLGMTCLLATWVGLPLLMAGAPPLWVGLGLLLFVWSGEAVGRLEMGRYAGQSLMRLSQPLMGGLAGLGIALGAIIWLTTAGVLSGMSNESVAWLLQSYPHIRLQEMLWLVVMIACGILLPPVIFPVYGWQIPEKASHWTIFSHGVTSGRSALMHQLQSWFWIFLAMNLPLWLGMPGASNVVEFMNSESVVSMLGLFFSVGLGLVGAVPATALIRLLAFRYEQSRQLASSSTPDADNGPVTATADG